MILIDAIKGARTYRVSLQPLPWAQVKRRWYFVMCFVAEDYDNVPAAYPHPVVKLVETLALSVPLGPLHEVILTVTCLIVLFL